MGRGKGKRFQLFVCLKVKIFTIMDGPLQFEELAYVEPKFNNLTYLNRFRYYGIYSQS